MKLLLYLCINNIHVKYLIFTYIVEIIVVSLHSKPAGFLGLQTAVPDLGAGLRLLSQTSEPDFDCCPRHRSRSQTSEGASSKCIAAAILHRLGLEVAPTKSQIEMSSLLLFFIKYAISSFELTTRQSTNPVLLFY